MKPKRIPKPLKPLHSPAHQESDLQPASQISNEQPKNEQALRRSLSENEDALRKVFTHCSDVVFRSVSMDQARRVLIVYVDGLVDTRLVDDAVLQPLLFEQPAGEAPANSLKTLEDKLLPVAQLETISSLDGVIACILRAQLAILVDGEDKALMADLKQWEKRSVSEPSAEIVVRGPREGFTETLRVNTAMIRRRIRSPQLKIEALTIGQFSQTDVAIVYLSEVASERVLEEVRQRIRRIQIDGVLESGYIEEFIEDSPWSPFPQIQNTERPDVVAASLLEGKVAIFVDNTPFVLVVPMTFWTGLQAAEDYYERSLYTTAVRFVRYGLFIISLLLPSLYVAATTYHPQLIPTNLLISIMAAREAIPFPTAVEVLIMEVMFEALREAGIRLPQPIGSAVSIVGALVIGEAAVQAGIVSAPTVIVVAATGISSFAIPRYNLGIAHRLLRFPLLLLAATLGLYGVMFGVVAIIIHLVNLRSFGVPYFSPVAPQLPADLKDVLIRAPRWALHGRPKFLFGHNRRCLDLRRAEGGQEG
ncbi:MAG: spore germination protein [Alicyclobacillus herbarius]|uniref:spore germination protein n=1 Tax=Alicyclobacillus herbarius TaxID=122960 RepID=UPI002354D9B4|nr:spore germination protein [Alicyclobacillus herbarius]MCL6631152.1 spore germination protein [Alicyclobacillus herbarius]